MLTVHDGSRRDFLRIGTLGLGGLSLPGLLSAADSPGERLLQDRSVVFLFLHGGPSQIETFDPKMTAPEGVRSATGEVKTSVPGVTFGGSFPRLGRLASQVSVVRSFVSGDGNHDIKPIVSRDSFQSNLGAVCSHIRGANDAVTGLPTNVALFPRAVEPKAGPKQDSFGKFEATGIFGPACAPFMPGAGGSLQRDMELRLPRERLTDRRHLLRSFDQLKAGLDTNADALDASREKAFHVLLKGAGDAFDITKENSRTVDRYDTAPLVRPENIDKKWRNYNHYVDNAKSLGRLMLLARRLCERGAGFVTVTTNFVWDMHADGNNAPMVEGMRYMGGPLDHAVSAFLEDVEVRGLSKKILLVVCGEMGRTPRLNKGGGRDHWGNLAPLLLAGGGLEMGRVVGQSTRNAGDAATEPVRIKHLIGTIFNAMVDVGKLRVQRGVPREVLTMAEYPTIPGL
jgi:Protein of unknown function (DUF1501)